jgi:hypothetical protein
MALGAGVLLSLGQRSADNQVGRYVLTQTGGSWCFITDTTTGETKLFSSGNNPQFDLPFAGMKLRPE